MSANLNANIDAIDLSNPNLLGAIISYRFRGVFTDAAYKNGMNELLNNGYDNQGFELSALNASAGFKSACRKMKGVYQNTEDGKKFTVTDHSPTTDKENGQEIVTVTFSIAGKSGKSATAAPIIDITFDVNNEVMFPFMIKGCSAMNNQETMNEYVNRINGGHNFSLSKIKAAKSVYDGVYNYVQQNVGNHTPDTMRTTLTAHIKKTSSHIALATSLWFLPARDIKDVYFVHRLINKYSDSSIRIVPLYRDNGGDTVEIVKDAAEEALSTKVQELLDGSSEVLGRVSTGQSKQTEMIEFIKTCELYEGLLGMQADALKKKATQAIIQVNQAMKDAMKKKKTKED